MMATPAERFLAAWHACVNAKRLDLLHSLIAEDAALKSPVFWSAKSGRRLMVTVLSSVFEIFEDFTYTGEWLKEREVILEFDCRIGDKRLKGIDRFTLDAEGRITELEVLMRPLNGLMAFAGEMRERLKLHTL